MPRGSVASMWKVNCSRFLPVSLGHRMPPMGHATALNHLNPTVPLGIVEAFTISQPSVKRQWTVSQPSVNYQWTFCQPSVNHQWTISQLSVNHQSTISQLSQPYFDGCLMLFLIFHPSNPQFSMGTFCAMTSMAPLMPHRGNETYVTNPYHPVLVARCGPLWVV